MAETALCHVLLIVRPVDTRMVCVVVKQDGWVTIVQKVFSFNFCTL